MIYLPYHNLNIIYNDHDNLEEIQNSNTFKSVCLVLDEAIEKLKNIPINQDRITFIMLDGKERLSLYLGVDTKQNPYLYIFDSHERTVSNTIQSFSFEKLGTPFFEGELMHKISHIMDQKPVLDERIIVACREMSSIIDKQYDIPKLSKILSSYICIDEKPMVVRDFKTKDVLNLEKYGLR